MESDQHNLFTQLNNHNSTYWVQDVVNQMYSKSVMHAGPHQPTAARFSNLRDQIKYVCMYVYRMNFRVLEGVSSEMIHQYFKIGYHFKMFKSQVPTGKTSYFHILYCLLCCIFCCLQYFIRITVLQTKVSPVES